MEDWQKDIMDAIENNRWQAEDLSDVAVPKAKPSMIPPVQNYEFILDIVYFAARELRGKKLTPEHKELLEEYDDVLRNQGMKGFHDANVQTHAFHADEDTDARDEKYYPNDPLHSKSKRPDVFKKSWTDILKSPFPNHMLNSRARGGRKVRKGTGRGGLFRYNEIDEILEARVTPLIDARYEKEIEKKTRESIREAKKRLKASNKEFSDDLKNYITRKVRKVLLKQKENNLYATAYGDYSKDAFGGKKDGKWFSGGLSALGYNPEDEQQMSYVLRRVHGIARQYFTNWKSKKEKEEEEMEEESDELVKAWIDILKKIQDYRFGRCQAATTVSFVDGVRRGGGNACIRPLKSPERRKAAGSSPKGRVCMYCEDDQYKYANFPSKKIYAMFPKFKEASMEEQKRMLDLYVKRNPRYNEADFKPYFD